MKSRKPVLSALAFLPYIARNVVVKARVDYPEFFPKGVKTLEELDKICIIKAAKGWNKRKP